MAGALDGLVPLSMDHAGAYAALLTDERVHPFVIENGPLASTHVENLASAALLARIGFTEVEPRRDPPRRIFQLRA